MDDRMMPQNLDAEKAVLGTLLSFGTREDLPWTIDDIRSIVDTPAFYLPDHQLIFDVIMEAADVNEPMDFLAIVPRLQEKRPAREWGDYAIELAESWSDLANAPFYAQQVRRVWQLREIIAVCHKAAEEAYTGRLASPEEIVERLTKRLGNLDSSTSEAETTSEVAALRSLENPRNKSGKVPVALDRVGAMLDGGFERGSLTIIGARPSTGKTSLGLGLAVFAARSADGCAVLFVSAEMSVEQITLRLLSMRTRISLQRLRAGDVENDQFNREREWAVVQAGLGRWIYLTEKRKLNDVTAAIRRSVRTHEVGLVIVDYLQLLSTDKSYESQNIRVGAMCKAFKHLASEQDIAVVLLCQLSRAAEGIRPTLAHLRDSGEIEQDADNVILLHKTERDANAELAKTDVILAKQRQGRIGVASLLYRKKTFSYEIEERVFGAKKPDGENDA